MIVASQIPSLAELNFTTTDAPIEQFESDDLVIRRRLKGKGKALISDVGDDVSTLEMPSTMITSDWTKYDPPEGLKYTVQVESDTMMQIIRESIERVKARILDEAKAAKPTEEQPSRSEFEKPKQRESLAIQAGKPSAQTDVLLDRPTTVGRDSRIAFPFPAEGPKRLIRRTRIFRNVFRTTNSGSEYGESSAIGAARSKLPRCSDQADTATQAAKRSFISGLFKKATDGTRTGLANINKKFEVECVSCFEHFSKKDIVRAPCHAYCRPCFRLLVASACQNEQQWPAKCCLNRIPYHTILLNLDAEQRNEYHARAEEWDVPWAERMYCSAPGCSLFIQSIYILPQQGIARCMDGHYTCTKCRQAQHEDGACPEDLEMMRTDQIAEEEGWKRCFGCKSYVEHVDACQHMTCRCGAEFCYVCGARWLTCHCSMEQLAVIKNEAQIRREARLVREEIEERERLEALRLVEEFEREEALKAELLFREQERLAEEQRRKEIEEQNRREIERRQREVEEHNRRERERRKAVRTKFEELRVALPRLHETQRIAVKETQDWRGQRTKLKLEETFYRMRANHDLERMFHTAKAEANILERESQLESECVARAAEERQIEEQYTIQIRNFWVGKEGADENIRAAILDQKRKMNKGFVAWQVWAKNELDTYRHHHREEQAIRAELMQYKEQRFEAKMREQSSVNAARNAAELRWVREVFEERVRLLQEMEIKETEDGEEIPVLPADDGPEKIIGLAL